MNDSFQDKDTTRTTGRRMAWLAALALIGLLWLFFAGVEDRRANPNRKVTVTPGENAELTLKRSVSGHYVLPGVINGQPVTFMLDTGATQVAIPATAGKKLGLRAVGPPIVVSTANGTAEARMTQVDELAFGPFVLRGVQASLNPGMDDDTILLGMNVLKQLEFTQRGDTLILRPMR